MERRVVGLKGRHTMFRWIRRKWQEFNLAEQFMILVYGTIWALFIVLYVADQTGHLERVHPATDDYNGCIYDSYGTSMGC